MHSHDSICSGWLPAPQADTFGREYSTHERLCLWCMRGTQYRDTNGCAFRSLSGTTNPSLSSQDSCLPDPRVSVWEWDFLHWPFKRLPVSLADFCLSLTVGISSDFHSQVLCGCLFLALVFWAGSPVWGWDLLFLVGVGVGPALFCTSAKRPSSQSQCGFCKSVVIRLLVSQVDCSTFSF